MSCPRCHTLNEFPQCIEGKASDFLSEVDGSVLRVRGEGRFGRSSVRGSLTQEGSLILLSRDVVSGVSDVNWYS